MATPRCELVSLIIAIANLGQNRPESTWTSSRKPLGNPKGASGRARTTIQRLIDAAHQTGQPVASLTRLTDA